MLNLLWRFFARTPAHRNFALLDSQGRCQAFKQCCQPPVGEGWVEVQEIRLSWMHHPLPTRARVNPRRARSSHRLPLTA
ncbi:hypothetical protein GIW56_01895 [Pseudomonas gessardii]|uniref:Uncharacterized protein n=1 Tax=Pseudomonas gessardii TaxID=78544 RepID=A0ABS9EZG9_9PSED|nr:hypothetical protein [Pseudomonas gessardii]MCF4977166.1 hypothetical protein [Pseudomonas gessardii]MCF4988143.1 hypothetical protein [Pseudomonas gessardii]MCF5083638.1 hypothetical protein [Pseudomonas gessardii]MCF5093609.1 hypothetical protein [Pseudomonas gessardii]MCF5105579.1 hypothetical protein [Pseudomonas gessardii]